MYCLFSSLENTIIFFSLDFFNKYFTAAFPKEPVPPVISKVLFFKKFI